MIDKNKTYAIIGASNNSDKYGFKVLKDLTEAGYKVYPINPKNGEILGLKVYKKIAEVPEKIDFVIFVVPPSVTEQVLPEVKKMKIENVWLQPGSESSQAIAYCQTNGINCIHHACIMIEKNK
ncbi:MAG: CoA-binding protein [Candidatus Buchananbacteria bacterium]